MSVIYFNEGFTKISHLLRHELGEGGVPSSSSATQIMEDAAYSN